LKYLWYESAVKTEISVIEVIHLSCFSGAPLGLPCAVNGV